MKKNILVVLSFISIISTVFSQELKFKVKDVQDSTVYLIKYIGSQKYYADTAELENGTVIFDGSKQEQGVMGLLLPDRNYFEFLHAGEPVYIETKAPNCPNNVIIKKSEENKVFYEYINFMKENTKKGRQLQKELAGLGNDNADRKKEIREELSGMGGTIKAFQQGIVDKHPGKLAAKIVKMSMDIEVPEAPRNEDGSLVDSNFNYHYFRDHYFENIDLKDSRLANTPVIQNKLEYYYSSKMLYQHPDTLIKYLTPVLEQIEEGSRMYQFVVGNVITHFEKSKIMGLDKVTNYLIARYLCSRDSEGNPKGFWMKKEKLEELCENTQKRLRLVQGVTPPNIILPDSTNQKWYNLYELESDYTILYFWDPNCGHCKKVTPKYQTLYEKKLKDRNVEIFAVANAVGEDFNDWKAFIKKHKLGFINVGLTQEIYEIASKDPSALIPSKTTAESINYQSTYDIFSTPRVWILDKDKKIVAKSLSVAQVELFLDKAQGKEESEKLFEVEEDKAEDKDH